MPRREDHEVRQGHVGHWIKKTHFPLNKPAYSSGSNSNFVREMSSHSATNVFISVLSWIDLVVGLSTNDTSTDGTQIAIFT